MRADVHMLGAFSAHAGQTELLRWFDAVTLLRAQVVLTHGEARGRDALALEIEQRQFTWA